MPTVTEPQALTSNEFIWGSAEFCLLQHLQKGYERMRALSRGQSSNVLSRWCAQIKRTATTPPRDLYLNFDLCRQ